MPVRIIRRCIVKPHIRERPNDAHLIDAQRSGNKSWLVGGEELKGTGWRRSATGKMIQSAYAKKKLLYYEMTSRHPKKGSLSAPLSVKVSDNLSLPTIEHWLHTFRHADETLYGAANLSALIHLAIDRW